MSLPPADVGGRARRLRPEPARFWIALAPPAWSWQAAPWTDLAAARLGRPTDPARLAPWPPAQPEDLAYLPPGASVPEAGAAGCLRQLLPGQRDGGSGAWVVWDLLAALVARDLSAFDRLSPGSAVWPLVPGLTDDRALWAEALPLLAAAGIRHVQPMTLELSPAEKRRLAAFGDEGVFEALFHGELPPERAFSRCAAQWGLRPFARRPLEALPGRRGGNRRLAGELLLAGELWLRCGRGEREGHALLRAGRWVETTGHDVPALVREGNLDVVPWLDGLSRAVLAATAGGGGGAPLLAELEAEYVAPEPDAEEVETGCETESVPPPGGVPPRGLGS